MDEVSRAREHREKMAERICTDRFMVDANHRGKRNPFVDGPCDDCIEQVVTGKRMHDE